jgi:hypothetical protein
MTAQAHEELVYNGEVVGMCTTPLDDYFELINSQPVFLADCTALWRGYIGEWLIENQRLYLTGIKNAKLFNGEEGTVRTLFSDSDGKVFAYWFTGSIRIPRGEMIAYHHIGFASVYERDEYLEIKDGVLIGRRLEENTLDQVSNGPGSLRNRLKAALSRLFR